MQIWFHNFQNQIDEVKICWFYNRVVTPLVVLDVGVNMLFAPQGKRSKYCRSSRPSLVVVMFSVSALFSALIWSSSSKATIACQGALADQSDKFRDVVAQGDHRDGNRKVTIRYAANGIDQSGLYNPKTKIEFKSLQASPLGVVIKGDKPLQTMMFHHKDGPVPPEAKALVVLLHGIGADVSHSGSMLPILNYLAGPKTAKKSGTMAGVHEKHMPLAMVAIDGPGNGYGPKLEEVPHLETYLELLKAQIETIKKMAPHLPLVVWARSASSAGAVAVNQRYPGLIDGLILMSPTTSEPRAWKQGDEGVQEDVRRAREQIEKGQTPEFLVNQETMEWDSRMHRQMRWHEDADPLKGVPTLVIVGTEDPQTPSLVQEYYTDLIGANDNGNFLQVPGAGHDVVSINPRNGEEKAVAETRAVGVYHAIYDFIGKSTIKP